MQRSLSMVTMLLGCTAKSEWTLYELDDGDPIPSEDTGEPDEGYVACAGVPESVPVDGDGDGTPDTCVANAVDEKPVTDGTIEEVFVRDEGTHVRIPSDGTVRVHTTDAVLTDPSGLTERYTSWDDGILYDTDGYDWIASFIGEDMIGEFQECAPWCSFSQMAVEHNDPDAATLDVCDEYSHTEISKAHEEVCFSVYYDTIEPPGPPGATCSSGAGTFRLAPRTFQDIDGDGDYIVMWRPLQETGGGSITGNAIVTRMKVLDDHRSNLYVINKDKQFVFGPGDQLVDSAVGTRLRAGRNTTFTGSVLGTAPLCRRTSGAPMQSTWRSNRLVPARPRPRRQSAPRQHRRFPRATRSQSATRGVPTTRSRRSRLARTSRAPRRTSAWSSTGPSGTTSWFP